MSRERALEETSRRGSPASETRLVCPAQVRYPGTGRADWGRFATGDTKSAPARGTTRKIVSSGRQSARRRTSRDASLATTGIVIVIELGLILHGVPSLCWLVPSPQKSYEKT